jgi:hypothetical protein
MFLTHRHLQIAEDPIELTRLLGAVMRLIAAIETMPKRRLASEAHAFESP